MSRFGNVFDFHHNAIWVGFGTATVFSAAAKSGQGSRDGEAVRKTRPTIGAEWGHGAAQCGRADLKIVFAIAKEWYSEPKNAGVIGKAAEWWVGRYIYALFSGLFIICGFETLPISLWHCNPCQGK